MPMPIMTNDELLLMAGVTQDQINTVKTSGALVSYNLLEQIHNKLATVITRINLEVAQGNNPLMSLMSPYVPDLGAVRDIAIQIRPKTQGTHYYGADSAPDAKTATNPWSNSDFGNAPLVRDYVANGRSETNLNYNPNAFLSAFLTEGGLNSYISGTLSTLAVEQVNRWLAFMRLQINVQHAQYADYSAVPIFSNAYDLQEYINRVLKDIQLPELNTQYKRVPYNTTGKGALKLILDYNFAFKFAMRFNMSNFASMFISQSSVGSSASAPNIDVIELDSLTATERVDKLATPQLLPDDVPSRYQSLALPANTKLIGRIVDERTYKAGIVRSNSVVIPKNAEISFYNQIDRIVLDEADWYVNVPLLISDSFEFNRIVYTTEASSAASRTMPVIDDSVVKSLSGLTEKEKSIFIDKKIGKKDNLGRGIVTGKIRALVDKQIYAETSKK